MPGQWAGVGRASPPASDPRIRAGSFWPCASTFGLSRLAPRILNFTFFILNCVPHPLARHSSERRRAENCENRGNTGLPERQFVQICGNLRKIAQYFPRFFHLAPGAPCPCLRLRRKKTQPVPRRSQTFPGVATRNTPRHIHVFRRWGTASSWRPASRS